MVCVAGGMRACLRVYPMRVRVHACVAGLGGWPWWHKNPISNLVALIRPLCVCVCVCVGGGSASPRAASISYLECSEGTRAGCVCLPPGVATQAVSVAQAIRPAATCVAQTRARMCRCVCACALVSDPLFLFKMNESFSFPPLYIGLFLSLSLCVCGCDSFSSS